MAQNRQKSANSRKLKFELSDGWQRDLVEFSVSYQKVNLALANRRLQPLGHLSETNFLLHCSLGRDFVTVRSLVAALILSRTAKTDHYAASGNLTESLRVAYDFLTPD